MSRNNWNAQWLIALRVLSIAHLFASTNSDDAGNTLRLYFVTWNVGTKYPENIVLNNLLGLESKPELDKDLPDFYIIGLQEVNSQPQNIVVNLFKADPWTQKFKEILKDRDYVAVRTEQMQGLLVIVFAKRKHLIHLREVETDCTRTGLAGIWGNKGAVSVRFSIYGNTLALVNAHLAAHDHKLDDRIEDFNEIIKDHHYHVKSPYKDILSHDYIFWFGDLNFRLMGDSTTPEDIKKMIKEDRLKELLEKDQLRYVMREKLAFHQLHERLPEFPPTFKFEEGTNEYDLKRRPAWCDRVLYRVSNEKPMKNSLEADQTSYKSHPNYSISDHKPVTSEFRIKNRITDSLTYWNGGAPTRIRLSFDGIRWDVNGKLMDFHPSTY